MGHAHHADGDIGLEIRRPGGRGHLPDLRCRPPSAARAGRSRAPARLRSSIGADLPHRPVARHPQQRVAPDAADRRLGVAEPAQPAFVRRVARASCRCRSSAVRPRSARSGSGSRRARPDRAPPPSARSRAACRCSAAVDVDLEAALLGIARAGDDVAHGPGTSNQPKRKNRMSRTASPKTRAISSSAFGPCTASGETSGSSTEHLQPVAVGDALDPEQQVAVGDGDPVAVLGQLHRHRVVQHAAGLVDDRHVEALARAASGADRAGSASASAAPHRGRAFRPAVRRPHPRPARRSSDAGSPPRPRRRPWAAACGCRPCRP